MSVHTRVVRRAFTLIELLVVVAIIAMLISILLPSLKCAREKARTARCGVQLGGLGKGLQAYASESNDWIPGVNTTGVAATVAGEGSDVGMLRRADTPIQNFDWVSPALRFETELGNNRAERLQTIINEYSCPSQQGLKVDNLYGLEQSPDAVDFTPDIQHSMAPLSYLMPVHFQYWGQCFRDRVIAVGKTASGRPITVKAEVAPWSGSGSGGWEAAHTGYYQSRIDKLGQPGRKVAAADGTRYLDENDRIDFDVKPRAQWFGAFASSGAWWAGSTTYGVASGTSNWHGTVMSQPNDDPPAQGRNLVWSYRHGCVDRSRITKGVRDNSGSINAVFFDGHVALLDDRASREIRYWYPTDTVVNNSKRSEGLTDVPVDYVVP